MDNQIITKEPKELNLILESIQSSNDAVVDSNNAIKNLTIYMGKKLEEQDQKIEDINKKLNHVDIDNYPEYSAQKGLGHKFVVPIGSQYTGKFLVATGLARKIDGNTTPYQIYLDNGIARNYISRSGHQHYAWHIEKTLRCIDKWLIKNDLHDEFSRINEIEDMKEFINNL